MRETEYFTYYSKYASYENCYFNVGYYNNGNLAVQIFSDKEGPVATVTVNPDIPIMKDMIAVKDYSENEGMVEWLCKQGLINLDPVNIIKSGWVEIPVHTLTDKGKEKFWSVLK